jgi:hypothetical protein
MHECQNWVEVYIENADSLIVGKNNYKISVEKP